MDKKTKYASGNKLGGGAFNYEEYDTLAGDHEYFRGMIKNEFMNWLLDSEFKHLISKIEHADLETLLTLDWSLLSPEDFENYKNTYEFRENHDRVE